MSKYEYTVIQMMENAIRTVKAQPIFLGGVSGSGGGAGGPPGGFVGKLPQRKVTYDTTEAESTGIIGSGTLVDNLNHIRYRIKQLEVASGTASIDIYDDGVQVATGVTIIDFYNSLDVTDLGGGHVRVDSTASGTTSGFITDAPIDGLLYGRQDGAWTVVSGVVTSGVATAFEVHEDLTPFVNGADTNFSTYYPIISGTLLIYYNGIRQEPINHYLEDTDHLGFTTLFTPSGGILLADYLTAVSGYDLPSAGTTIVYYSSGAGSGDMLKSIYDTNNNGIVDEAESVAWSGITGKPATFPPDSHTHTFLSLTDTPSAYTGFSGYVLSVKGDESGVEFTLTSGGVSDHTLLSNLNSTNYYHLTQTQYTDLTDGGNTTLHTHTFSGGGHTIKDEGTSLPARTYLNFIGSGVYAVDNLGADSTDVTISGASIIDAANVTYTPVDVTDWTSSTDPGNANGALDQLVDRLKTLEGLQSSGGRTLIGSEQTPTGTGTVSFTSIPGTYKKLVLEFAVRSTQSATSVNGLIECNGDTTDANYQFNETESHANTTIGANGSTTRTFTTGISAANTTANSFTIGKIEIIQYANTAFYKQIKYQGSHLRDTSSIWEVNYSASTIWKNTSAITQIDIVLSAGNFATNSVLRLYGEN